MICFLPRLLPSAPAHTIALATICRQQLALTTRHFADISSRVCHRSTRSPHVYAIPTAPRQASEYYTAILWTRRSFHMITPLAPARAIFTLMASRASLYRCWWGGGRVSARRYWWISPLSFHDDNIFIIGTYGDDCHISGSFITLEPGYFNASRLTLRLTGTPRAALTYTWHYI